MTDRRKLAFGKRVLNLREEQELTQIQLGKRVGVTGTCVWNWEGGNTFPRPVSLSKLARALGTSAEYLTTGEQSPREIDRPAPAASQPIAEVIMRARREIAAAAGIDLEKVRVNLEWGD